MILIADSGGSKTDWRLLLKDGSIEQASAPGFNPYYQSIDDLKKSIQEILIPAVNEPVSKIYFYGAGVSSEKNQQTVHDAIAEFFTVKLFALELIQNFEGFRDILPFPETSVGKEVILRLRHSD